MAKTFNEAFQDALEMSPEDISKEPIDEFIQEAFNIFEEMSKIIEKEIDNP